MSADLVDMIISLTVETLFDSAIANKQLARNLRVFVQKIVSNQTIRLLRAVCFHDQRR
jgi:hypothetical protein